MKDVLRRGGIRGGSDFASCLKDFCKTLKAHIFILVKSTVKSQRCAVVKG